MAKPQSQAGKPAKSSRSRFSNRQILFAALALHLVLSLAVFDPKLSTGGDNAHYLILAKSILQGSYSNLFEPGSPPHSQYPPVFPLLLAPMVAISGGSFIPPKLMLVAFGVGALILFYLVLRRLTSGKDWVLPLVLLAVSPLYLTYAHYLFTELPFILLSLPALYFLLRGGEGRRRWLFAGLAGLFAALAFLTRTQGLALPLGLAIFLGFKRRWQELGVFALVFFLTWLPWLQRDLRVPHEAGYLAQLFRRDWYNAASGNIGAGEFVKRIFENLGIYLLRVFPAVMLPMLASARAVLPVFGVLVSGFALWGFVAEARRHGMGMMEWYVLLAAGILMVWPTIWSGDRFLLPILPLLVWYLVVGFRELARRLKLPAIPAYAAGAIALVCLVSNVGQAQTSLRNLSDYAKGDRFAGYDDAWRTYFQAAEWLRVHTDTNAVVVSRKPQFTYLYSGRKSFVYPFIADEKQVLGEIDRKGATHVFLETFFGSSAQYLFPVIRDHPERFQQIGTVGAGDVRVLIYEVKR
jgi:4-amino-4-deoxy-L-arabinose transferase-like glycosyltransferase